ncbi:Zinc finger, RING-CH-type [Cynara cardunculus var. scolymus]|uniref:Zinc finger, RING-CH-type n=1 Tax=Cynara cardunculus var. scolymus TaxID=59895 RepID=A0A103XPV1_CYNCS|nr:Zinc finger, RING-CH-type [Cynara cardunculus var. scolymus]
MSATDSVADIEIAAIAVEGGDGVENNGVGRHRRRRRRGCSHRRRRNIPFDYSTSLIFSDPEDHSSPYLNASVGSSGMLSYNQCHGGYLPEGVDLESGELEAKVHSSANDAKQCRICHLNFEHGDDDDDGDGDDDDDDDDRGYAMELGCDCKGDLGTAHQKCAVTWFLIKGSLNCEICGAIAQNLCFQPIEEENYDVAAAVAEVQTPDPEPEPEPESEPEHVSPRVTEPVSESESSVCSRWFVNGVLACMVLAFVVSWLVHYNNLQRSD